MASQGTTIVNQEMTILEAKLKSLREVEKHSEQSKPWTVKTSEEGNALNYPKNHIIAKKPDQLHSGSNTIDHRYFI